MFRFLRHLAPVFLAVGLVSSCSSHSSPINTPTMAAPALTATAPPQAALACKLTSPELQRRQATVMAHLKSQVLTKKELPDGFAYEFPGSDAMLDELVSFIKTERQCCDFFSFQLAAGAATHTAWLEIKGPEGVKEAIANELAL